MLVAAASRLHLGCISAVSRLYLGWIMRQADALAALMKARTAQSTVLSKVRLASPDPPQLVARDVFDLVASPSHLSASSTGDL